MFFEKTKKTKFSGFTTIELLVVITIFLIITGIVLVSIPQIKSRSKLDLVTQKTAVAIREAQNYGSNKKTIASGGYGIDFMPAIPDVDFSLYAYEVNRGSDPITYKKTMTSPPADDPPILNYTFDDFTVRAFFCKNIACTGSDNIPAKQIVYEGSRYDYLIYANLKPAFFTPSSGDIEAVDGASQPYSKVVVQIISNVTGDKKCIFVYKNGQITINNTNEYCP